MTRYTVVWDPELENAFASAWIAGDSKMRSTLTAISDWLDAQLAEDPEVKGWPRPDLAARTVDVPLSISSARVEATYKVLPADRLVRVTRLVFRIN